MSADTIGPLLIAVGAVVLSCLGASWLLDRANIAMVQRRHDCPHTRSTVEASFGYLCSHCLDCGAWTELGPILPSGWCHLHPNARRAA